VDSGREEVAHRAGAWVPEIVRTVATRGEGVEDLLLRLEKHRAWLRESEAGAARMEVRLREAMRVQLREALAEAALAALGPALDEAAQAVARREVDPYTAAERLVAAFQGGAGPISWGPRTS
jgi:LAO/AO transport system kinase